MVWTDGRTDAKVVLYSVQCCTLHWTDNKVCVHYFIEPSNWSTHSTWSECSGLFNMGCCYAAAILYKIKNIDNLIRVLMNELWNGAVDQCLNDCYWTFVHSVNTLKIVSINLVVWACWHSSDFSSRLKDGRWQLHCNSL